MADEKDLQKQLETARKDIEVLAKLAGEHVRDRAHDGVATAQDGLAQLSSEARAVYDRSMSEGQRARAAAEAQIQQHPLASTGIAFAAGFALAGLLSRR